MPFLETQETRANPQNQMSKVMQEDAAVAHDLANGHIQPKTYQSLFEDKSTLGKIGTIFGLMVGGMGAGLTHTENPVLAMMRNQIGNDLEAQKANISNKQTLLAMNRQRFPDIESATNFTRMQLNRMTLDDLNRKVQNLPPGSPAQIKAQQSLQTVGQAINTDNYNLSGQIAAKQAFLNSTQGQAMSGSEAAFQSQQNMLRRGNEQQQKLAELNEAHHVAGIPGQSSVALTPENRDALQSKQFFDQRLGDFINFANQNSGSLDPRVISVGKAKANELNGLYRNATHGGIYKEGEANFINQVIDSNPTKFFNVLRGVIPKAQELRQNNSQSLNNYKQNLGFPSQQQSQPSQLAQGQSQYKTVNGVKYMRGPNGEAVPVNSSYAGGQ